MIPLISVARQSAASTGVQTARMTQETQGAQEASGTASGGSLKPARDEYIPGEEKRESYGRYWLDRDEDGSPKICFDDPEAAEEAPASPEDPEEPEDESSRVPGKPEGKKEEMWRGSTDAVDREIKELKKKREELEKRLSSEADEAKIKELERKLSQVENELRQKDNDAYRRQHSTFTRIS